MTAPLLRLRDLTVSFATYGGVLQALAGVSFDVDKGRYDPAVKKFIQPGELINCRCTAAPFLPGVTE